MDLPPKHDTLAQASGDDPWIGVHLLTEFVFCPRAGLLEYEKRTDGEPEDPAAPLGWNLGSMPLLYDRDASERHLGRRLPLMLTALVCLVAGIALGVVSNWAEHPRSIFVAVLLVVSGLGYLVRYGATVIRLAMQRQQALAAEACEPSVDGADGQSVNWWSMLAAGFESIRYTLGHDSEQARFATGVLTCRSHTP